MKRWLILAILLISTSAWAGPPKINGTTVSKIDGLAASKCNGLAGGTSCSGTGTLGESSVGASAGSTKAGCGKWTAGSDICVTKGYYKSSMTSAQHLRIVIWADNAGTPGTLIATSSEITGTGTTEWLSATFSPSVQLSNGVTYWIGYIADSTVSYFYSSDASPVARYYNDTYSGYPTPASPYSGTSGTDRNMRIYVTN